MSLMGRIERDGNSVAIHRKHDDAPWCRVDLDGSGHSIVFLDDSSRHDLPQVNSPWRTWSPRLLPEHQATPRNEDAEKDAAMKD